MVAEVMLTLPLNVFFSRNQGVLARDRGALARKSGSRHRAKSSGPRSDPGRSYAHCSPRINPLSGRRIPPRPSKAGCAPDRGVGGPATPWPETAPPAWSSENHPRQAAEASGARRAQSHGLGRLVPGPRRMDPLNVTRFKTRFAAAYCKVEPRFLHSARRGIFGTSISICIFVSITETGTDDNFSKSAAERVPANADYPGPLLWVVVRPLFNRPGYDSANSKTNKR